MREYLIWSFEHDMWWKPNERGYTRDIRQAGHYPLAQAMEIVRMANSHLRRDQMPQETLIPLHAVTLPIPECKECHMPMSPQCPNCGAWAITEPFAASAVPNGAAPPEEGV